MLFQPKEKGQGLVEYALILVLVAFLVILCFWLVIIPFFIKLALPWLKHVWESA